VRRWAVRAGRDRDGTPPPPMAADGAHSGALFSGAACPRFFRHAADTLAQRRGGAQNGGTDSYPATPRLRCTRWTAGGGLSTPTAWRCCGCHGVRGHATLPPRDCRPPPPLPVWCRRWFVVGTGLPPPPHLLTTIVPSGYLVQFILTNLLAVVSGGHGRLSVPVGAGLAHPPTPHPLRFPSANYAFSTPPLLALPRPHLARLTTFACRTAALLPTRVCLARARLPSPTHCLFHRGHAPGSPHSHGSLPWFVPSFVPTPPHGNCPQTPDIGFYPFHCC